MRRTKRDPGTGLVDLNAPPVGNRFDYSNAPPADAEVLAGQSVVVENPDDVGNLAEESDVFSDIGRVLGELDATDAGGAKVIIWRLDQRNPREKAFLDEIAPQEFGMKWLMDTHGGGRFNIRVYVPQRDPDTGAITSRVQLAANKVLTIAGEPRVKRAMDDTPNVPAKADDSAALALAIAGAMREGFTHVATLIEKNQPKQQSMMDMLQQMVLMKQILGGGAPAADPAAMLKSTLGIVKDITEMSALRGGGDGGGDGGDGVMAVLMKSVLDRMMATHAQLPSAPAAPHGALTVEQLAMVGVTAQQAAALGLAVVDMPENVQPIMPAPTVNSAVEREINPAPPAAVEPEGDDNMGLQQILIRAALEDALTNAARNTPVAEYAERIYPECPDSLFELLERPDWREVLTGAAPRVANFPLFFTQLRDALIKLDAEDTDDEQAP